MRERFSAVSSFSLRRTSFFASLNGLMRPMARHLAEVADHRRHRHALEQRVPNSDFVEPLRRDGFARQVEFVMSFTISSLLEARFACSNASMSFGSAPTAAYFATRSSPRTLRFTSRSPSESAPFSIQRNTASCCGEGAFG